MFGISWEKMPHLMLLGIALALYLLVCPLARLAIHEGVPEKTQKVIFVALMILPTVLVGAWIFEMAHYGGGSPWLYVIFATFVLGMWYLIRLDHSLTRKRLST